MSKTAFSAQNTSVQVTVNQQPLQIAKPKKPFFTATKQWDLMLKISELEYLAKVVEKGPKLISAREIEEIKLLTHEIILSNGCDKQKTTDVMELAFRAFSNIVIFTNDEEARRAATDARAPFARRPFCEALLSDFGVLANTDPRIFTAKGIEDMAEIAKGVLSHPNRTQEKNRLLRDHLFTAFSYVCMFTHDEGARRAAQKAREAIPYPFGPKYGQVKMP